MFVLLFGAGRFDDCFGDVIFTTVVKLQMKGISDEEKIQEEIQKTQKERIERLVEIMLKKIKKFEEGEGVGKSSTISSFSQNSSFLTSLIT
jgi:ferritin-like protein